MQVCMFIQFVGHVEMLSNLEFLRLRKRELEREVENVKSLIARLNQAPVEMRRHHSFVCESARIVKGAANNLYQFFCAADGLLKPMLESMYLASAQLRDHMKALVAIANKNEPVSPHVLRQATNGGLHACKSFLENLAEVRCGMRVVIDDCEADHRRLQYRAKLVRAGAKAILRNLSADDAEANVRREFEHLGQFD